MAIRSFPTYRVFLIAVGAALVAVLWYGFDGTKIGAMIRAAVDNRRMAQSVGINVDRLFTMTFAVGSGLAALGGGLAIQLLGLTPSFAVIYLVFFLLVVAVGGSAASGVRSPARSCSASATPPANTCSPMPAASVIYAVAVLILLVRPAGLYGRE